MRRRDLITSLTLAGTAAGLAMAQTPQAIARKGRLKQCAMLVNFPANTPLDDICREAVRVGCRGMDLIPSQDWPTLRKYGLTPSTAPRARMTIEDGVIRKELHDAMEQEVRERIDKSAEFGCPNIIVVGGQKRGLSYRQGADNLVAFFNRVKGHAEDKGINLCLEIMNSRYDDPAIGRTDQVCDHLAFGVDICKRVNSPRMKLLFDIYHVQVADGNICANIRDNFQWIGHFHTGGVPGRYTIGEESELNYRFIAQTIAGLGYTGYVAHEHRTAPGRNAAQDLQKAVDTMDV